MLTKVEVRNSRGNLLTLDLEAELGLLVQEIQGLDPVKASIVSSSYAKRDGARYQAARRAERNITMQIGLEPDHEAMETVQDLRTTIYDFFMTKARLELRFFRADGLDVDIVGFVETCENSIFTQEPTMDISLMCLEPDFIDPTPVEIEGDTVDDETELLIPYAGTVETGFLFRLLVDRSITELTLYHRAPNDDLRILEFSAPMVAGDILEISTVALAQAARLTHLGTPSSVMYGVSTQSKWTEFTKGDNYFRAYAEGAPIPFELVYSTKYGAL